MLPRKKVESDIYDLSRSFALRIVNLYKYLVAEKKEYVMSKQLLRCGTSIGANAYEAKNAQSRADFSSKMNIALKEATETGFWIDLLFDAAFITSAEYESLMKDSEHVLAVLTKFVKATKRPQQQV